MNRADKFVAMKKFNTIVKNIEEERVAKKEKKAKKKLEKKKEEEGDSQGEKRSKSKSKERDEEKLNYRQQSQREP